MTGSLPVVELGSSGLNASALAMGCVKLASGTAAFHRTSQIRLVHAAVDDGVTLFDTADAYSDGASEEVLGAALRGRPEVLVATKVGYLFRPRRAGGRVATLARSAASRVGGAGNDAYSRQDFSSTYVRDAAERSLRRLGRDRIDLLQLHAPPPPERCPAVETLRELVVEGKVRAFGVGCESLESAEAWSGVDGLGCVQLPFGVLDPEAATGVLAQLAARRVGTIVRGVLGGGVIARFMRGQASGVEARRERWLEELRDLADERGVTVADLALWFALGTPTADVVLVGISDRAQLASVTSSVRAAVDGEVLDRIRQIVSSGQAT